MKTVVLLIVATLFVCGSRAICIAQNSIGHADPSGLVGADQPNDTTAASNAVKALARLRRPEGTLTRTKDGVSHPDLDRAWDQHDAVVVTIAESIQAAIGKQFDTVTATADLDAAEKWQAIRKRFEDHGELPDNTETEAVVISASDAYWEAKGELAKAYDAVIKDLTREQQIDKAKAVREELRE